MQYISFYKTPLGSITMASEGEKLTGLWFDGQKYFASTLAKDYKTGESPVLRQTKEWLDLYFDGQIPDFMPPLGLSGSPFRIAVWEILKQIPYGQVTTYGEIAAQIARQQGQESMSSQAVGGAVAHNPISILIPCHRVVGSSGGLTGYAGGLDKKCALLRLEKIHMSKRNAPAEGTV